MSKGETEMQDKNPAGRRGKEKKPSKANPGAE